VFDVKILLPIKVRKLFNLKSYILVESTTISYKLSLSFTKDGNFHLRTLLSQGYRSVSLQIFQLSSIKIQ